MAQPCQKCKKYGHSADACWTGNPEKKREILAARVKKGKAANKPSLKDIARGLAMLVGYDIIPRIS